MVSGENYTKLLTGTPNGKEDSMSQIETAAQLGYVLPCFGNIFS